MDTKILEREVLTYILIEPTLFPSASAVVAAQCFKDESFNYIYRMMYELHIKGLTIEYNNLLTSILTDLKDDAIKKEVIENILFNITNVPNFKYDLKLFEEKIYSLAFPVWEDETKLNLSKFILEVSNKHISNAKKIEEMRARFNNRLDSAPVAKNKSNKGKLFKAKLLQGKLPSYQVGYKHLDRMLGGLMPAQFIILAGRPAMGKSSGVYNWVDYYLRTYNEGIIFFSLEINSDGIYKRLASLSSGVDPSKLVSGTMNAKERKLFDKQVDFYIEKEEEGILHIETDGKYTLSAIEQEVRLIGKRKKVGMIVVDYIQLIQAGGNSYERTTKISQGLKEIARKYEIIVIGLSQLSRGVEQRADKHPLMSDLRDSGSLEQDADKIIMVYRDDYYHPDKTPTNTVEFSIVKNREGGIGNNKLTINLVTGKIGEPE